MPDSLLRLTLSEPLTLGQRPVVSNEIQTLEYIPATTLRGSLAAALIESGRATDLEAWFGLDGPLWTAALPCSPTGVVVPMPLSFVQEKGDVPFEGEFCVWNTLHGQAPKEQEEYLKQTGETLAEPRRFDWRGTRAKWLEVVQGRPHRVNRVGIGVSMHVGLHYGRQSSRSGALFSRQEIDSRTSFQAWVHDPKGVLQGWPRDTFLGKRRTAGNGAATVAVSPSAYPWMGAPLQQNQTEVNIQLIADAIVPDANGAFLRGLDEQDWGRLLGLPVKVLAKASAFRTVSGWSGAWGLPREQAVAICAGSVFRVACADVAGFHSALAQFEASGIGVRRHEGFGFVSINPPWLEAKFIAPRPRPKAAAAGQPGSTLPGLENVESSRVVLLIGDAQDLGAGRDAVFAAKVRQLAAYSERAGGVQAVLDYLQSLAKRPNPRGWEKVEASLGEYLKTITGLQELQFFLQALAVNTGARQRNG